MQIPDRIDPLLTQSQGTQGTQKIQPDRQALGPLEEQIEKLKQLIMQLRQVMVSLPADLAQMVSSLIAQAELAISSKDPISIGQLIIKLEEALEMIQALLLAQAKGDIQAAQEIAAAFIAKIKGLKKSRDKLFQQQQASLEGSLEAMLRQKFTL